MSTQLYKRINDETTKNSTNTRNELEHAIETKAETERRVKEACAVARGCDRLQLQLGSVSQLDSYIMAAREKKRFSADQRLKLGDSTVQSDACSPISHL